MLTPEEFQPYVGGMLRYATAVREASPFTGLEHYLPLTGAHGMDHLRAGLLDDELLVVHAPAPTSQARLLRRPQAVHALIMHAVAAPRTDGPRTHRVESFTVSDGKKAVPMKFTHVSDEFALHPKPLLEYAAALAGLVLPPEDVETPIPLWVPAGMGDVLSFNKRMMLAHEAGARRLLQEIEAAHNQT